MRKIPVKLEFGDSVLVVLRTTVQGFFEYEDSVEILTDNGAFSTDDDSLIAVFPDPDED